MRPWSVSAFFPEVKPAHEATQSCTVEAASMGIAARLALSEISQREAIKGRHLTVAKLSIVLAGKEKSSLSRKGGPRRAARAEAEEDAA